MGTGSQTHMGEWWTPEHPERRVFGVLSTAPNGMSLATASPLVDEFGRSIAIRGRTHDGTPVSLIDCFCASDAPGFSSLYGSWHAQEFKVGTVLLGGRVGDDLETRFRFASVSFSGLSEFVAYRPFRPLREPNDGHEATIAIDHPRKTQFLHGNVDITLSVRALDTWSPASMSAALTTDTWLTFRSQVARTVDEWHHDYLRPVETLVSLGLGRACTVSEVRVLASDTPRTHFEDGGRIAVPPPFVTVLRGEPLPGSQDARAGSMLFTLEDDVILEAALPRWLDAHGAFRLPIDMYFATVFAPFMYLESRFLNLVQAAEGYHRLRSLNARQADAHKRVGLKERLVDLIGLARNQGLKMDAGDDDRFARRVKQARDELSHGGLGKQRMSPQDYLSMEHQVEEILKACWLHELGVSPNESAKMLNRWA